MRISVDGSRIRNNNVAFSNLSSIVWTGPKTFLIKDHLSVSNAFSKSKKSNKPGIFFEAVYVIRLSISLIFSPINLPFINPA